MEKNVSMQKYYKYVFVNIKKYEVMMLTKMKWINNKIKTRNVKIYIKVKKIKMC